MQETKASNNIKMIQITEAALKEIKRLQLARKQPNSILKVEVKTGGCNGFIYQLDLKSDGENLAEIMHINSLSVNINPESYKYVKNLKIDYSEDLMGGGFRFQNPDVATNCSCGQSFAIDSVRSSK